MPDPVYVEVARKFFEQRMSENPDLYWDEINALATLLTEEVRKARLRDALVIRAKYHHAEEIDRPMMIVKYMDKHVAELEASANGR